MKSQIRIVTVFLSALTGACVTTSDGTLPGSEGVPEEAARYNVQLGLQYLAQGRRELAMEKLTRALDQDPRNPDAHTAMAFAYERFGEPDLADRHYRRALRLDRGKPETKNTYGVFLCRRGRLDEAERQLLAAVEDVNYPTPEVALTNAGICAERVPDLEKAERFYRRALQANDRHADALWSMARLSFDSGEMLPARAFLQRYFENAPFSAETLWLGYRIEMELGDEDAARMYATRLRVDFADSEEARLLADAERGRKR